MFKSTFSFRTMFSKMTKRKASSAMAEAQVVSSSNLSSEIEARINRLPKSWQAGCREVMEEQTPELQLIQFDIYEGLISLANSLSCPPLSSNIKEIVHEAPRPVDLNMDECLGWFRGTEGEYDDEEEEDEEDFDDDASCRWFPEEWRTSSELVSDSPRIIPNNLRQVKVSDSIVEHAPAFLDHSALPILISLPPSISSSFAVTCDIVKPLQRAVRTKRRNGISVAPARTAIPTPVVVRPSQPTKMKTVTLKRVNHRRSLSVRPSATQDWQRYCAKPLRTHRLPQDDSRELQGVEHSCQFPTDISYSDFAHELDERRTMFNGTSALAQLPVLPLRRRPATSTKKMVSLTGKRPTSYSGRRLAGKENWHRLDRAPLLQRAIPTTLGDVIPRVEDPQLSSWCHLAMDVSYGDFANGLDERRMLFDDASTIIQDWD